MMCSALGDVPCCSEHGFSALQLAFHLDIDLDALYNEFANKSFKRSRKSKKLLLEELGIDLTKKALNGELDPVVGRDNEIKRLLGKEFRDVKVQEMIQKGLFNYKVVEGTDGYCRVVCKPKDKKNEVQFLPEEIYVSILYYIKQK